MAGRRVVYPCTEQMSRKLSEKSEKRGVQAARLPLEPGGTGSKLSYRSQQAQRSGERVRAGSSHTCLRRIAAGRNMSMINTTSNWLALFTHSLFRLFLAFAGHWSLSSRPTPHAPRPTPTPHAQRPTPYVPRSSGSAVDAARRAGYSTPPPRRGQHATTCYVFRFRQKFGEPGFRRKLILNNNLRLFLP